MKTYPANLLLENRKCLVVGGGKVAARKLDRLVESGADVKVVAAKASNKIKDLAEFEKLELLERNFEENDLENIFLAFAATDDRELNSKIFALAEKRGILCCVVDRNWKKRFIYYSRQRQPQRNNCCCIKPGRRLPPITLDQRKSGAPHRFD